MKLAHKLTALLVVGNCVVLSGYGLLARKRERDMFERTMERDTFLAGSTLLATVEDGWTQHGRGEALRLIDHASEQQEDMSFRWLTPDEVSKTVLTPAQAQRLARGERACERSEGALHMYVPFTSPSGEQGILEVTKDLAADEGYLYSSTALLLAATLVSIAVSALIVFLIGSALVGKPMNLLVERVERVGAGNLAGRLDLGRSDEIGALASALDGMSTDLQEASARAEAEAAERRATLRQLRHAERLATVGRLAAGVAHELGTPLNVVLARAKLIERDPSDPETLRKHVEIIREQTQRMTRIIRQLLDFARRGECEKVLTDVRPLAEGVLETLQPLAAKRGVTLELSEPREAWIEADPGQLQQVLTNLVMNALQASPAGGTVSVALREASTTPPPDHGGSASAHWCFEVRDRGQGIPKELQERIFEPFFTTKEVGEGTGLGLTVTHGIVSDHDGWITVESEPGGGATFIACFPAAARPAEVLA